ncbi:MAG: nucleotide exchange factor GrpE [Candidatus Neomarinimicrobiota bacterium]|jgi:molecular chaperone GrpE|nr:nucleotide exchange factor GrpE [Candidatus Neomarinimicrobiota bacterium]MDD3966911.1 nucleotide exchange factor GrpE [Candidatus Neomarinimicrobiota bacterium]MDX9779819.1 nucleotide exchange factor GrpE [bacterium]
MSDEKNMPAPEQEKGAEKPVERQEKENKNTEKKARSTSAKKEKTAKATLNPKEIDSLILENADLKAQCRENQDNFLLLAAEFENFKKRTNKDQLRAREFYKENLLLDLLPVLDDIERAIKHHGEDETGKAFTLIFTQLLAYLAKYEVAPFDAVGTDFDPERHDAMLTRSESDKKHNTVLEEFQKGYTIGSKILRHAKVIVNITE